MVPPSRLSQLFVRPDDAEPMEFHLLAGLPRPERCRLQALVEDHGGALVANPARCPHAVTLGAGTPGSQPRPAVSDRPDTFSTQFLDECVRRGRVVSLCPFRLQPTSLYSRPGQVNAVLLGRCARSDLAVVTALPDSDSDDELRLLTAAGEPGRGAAPYRGRLRFSREKDEALVRFVAEHGCQRYAPPTAPKFWHLKAFLLPALLADHPPLSLHTHFIKQVRPRLADFKSTVPVHLVARAAEATATRLALTEDERRAVEQRERDDSRQRQRRLRQRPSSAGDSDTSADDLLCVTDSESEPGRATAAPADTPAGSEAASAAETAAVSTVLETAPSAEGAELETAPSAEGAELEISPSAEGAELETAPSAEGADLETAPSSEGAELETAPSAEGAELETAPSAEGAELETAPSSEGAELETAPSAEGAELETAPSAEGAELEMAPSVEGADLETAPCAEGAELETAPSAEGAELETAPSAEGAELEMAPSVEGADLETAPCAEGADLETVSSAEGAELETAPGAEGAEPAAEGADLTTAPAALGDESDFVPPTSPSECSSCGDSDETVRIPAAVQQVMAARWSGGAARPSYSPILSRHTRRRRRPPAAGAAAGSPQLSPELAPEPEPEPALGDSRRSLSPAFQSALSDSDAAGPSHAADAQRTDTTRRLRSFRMRRRAGEGGSPRAARRPEPGGEPTAGSPSRRARDAGRRGRRLYSHPPLPEEYPERAAAGRRLRSASGSGSSASSSDDFQPPPRKATRLDGERSAQPGPSGLRPARRSRRLSSSDSAASPDPARRSRRLGSSDSAASPDPARSRRLSSSDGAASPDPSRRSRRPSSPDSAASPDPSRPARRSRRLSSSDGAASPDPSRPARRSRRLSSSDYGGDADSSARSRRERQAYSWAEEEVLLRRVLAEQAAGGLLGGRRVWERLQDSGVLPGRSWQSLKEHWRRMAPRLRNSARLTESQRRQLCRALRRPAGPGRRGAPARPYTRAEDLAMLRYLQEEPRRALGVSGRALWQEMAAALARPGRPTRSWQSLKERFHKRIAPALREYREVDSAFRRSLADRLCL
ncbi:nucleolar protein dao-5-like [Amphibalanus amphitrite]|uniref:nucleolar protein dao-5-like n=1 Tax=Amphibalanus amphitrite TaxID=1232801 RepID=UPI001C90FAA6|nr:nucleolar protein dao-5-like [Amphibalanus amphitrite]XP_043191298.1 nucleolar protein dao-5-like [Amphibalanus amphitrite]XP_043191300.1 nucleolar protein dao-5-like [Amphibalanus amphitrite]XP_043225940.1 nucleolar protein dao-5-like [Amphibalanus amphitrite]